MVSDAMMPMGESWRTSPAYDKALDHVQRAEWEQAVAVLTNLLAAHPEERDLQSMLTEAQLRLEAEKQQVKTRRLRLPSQRFLYTLLLVAVVAALALAAQRFYSSYITPSLSQTKTALQQEALALQARQSLASGDYKQALTVYDRLRTLNPSHPSLEPGVAEANRSIDLANRYEMAQQQLAAGKLTEAQATLVGIQELAPTYRDVGSLLVRIERRQRLTGLMREARDAQGKGDWEAAVLSLQDARSIAPREDKDAIEAELFEAYLALGRQLVAQSDGVPAAIERANTMFSKALALQPNELRACTQLDSASQYLSGYRAFSNARHEDAISQLEALYAGQPEYVGGKATQLLFDAYMRSANLLAQNPDTASSAWERYYRAGQLKGVDTTAARTLAASLAAVITPTPKPTAAATMTPVPPSKPVAAAQATPTQMPVSYLRGKIIYMSNRGGPTEYWVMDSDGRNAYRPDDQQKTKAEYERLMAAETVSPDGAGKLTVSPTNNQSSQIGITYSDGRSVTVTNLVGKNYEAVWSPTGHWVAFVSNQQGNDEIFAIGINGENLKQLTRNDWEADRRPSWSSDGNRLVFWSNRISGRGQIWTMNADGSAQTNLSNNQYDERDPLWVK